jgi:methyl-accepting chemotaxis protein
MMNQLNSLSLKYKVALLPVLLVLIMITINTSTYFDLKKVEAKTDLTSELYAKEAKIASAILENTLQRRAIIYQYLRVQNKELITKYQAKANDFNLVIQQFKSISNQSTNSDKVKKIKVLDNKVNDTFIKELVEGSKKISSNNAALINEITPLLIQEIFNIKDLAEVDELQDIMYSAGEMIVSVMNARAFMQNYILTAKEEDAERFYFEIDASLSHYDDLVDVVESDDFSESMSASILNLNEFKATFDQTKDLFAKNKDILNNQLEVKIQELLNITNSYNDDVWNTLNSNGKEIKGNINVINATNITTTIILIIATALILLFIISRILTPLKQMLATMHDIAEGEGDLSIRIELDVNDEIGKLANEFNKFLDKLHSIIAKLSGSAESLLSSSQSVSDEMGICQTGITQQRNETEQAATAINQMAATSTEVASSAESTLAYIQTASVSIQSGEQAVNSTTKDIHNLADNINNAVTCTKDLSQKSSDVAAILTSIHAITDQTNLLALNAAIEAARAGEHGRGFSVVAEEVRALATRTHQSTDEIQGIIIALQSAAAEAEEMLEKSNQQVLQCVKEVTAVDESFTAITQAIGDIDGQMAQVASAMEEQAVTIDEINRNITQVNDISFNNLQSIESTSSNSNDLLAQITNVNELVAEFKL